MNEIKIWIRYSYDTELSCILNPFVTLLVQAKAHNYKAYVHV